MTRLKLEKENNFKIFLQGNCFSLFHRFMTVLNCFFLLNSITEIKGLFIAFKGTIMFVKQRTALFFFKKLLQASFEKKEITLLF